MKLTSNVIKVDELMPQNKKDMFEIMTKVYDGENWERFLNDLSEKNFVLLLFKENMIVGFTTMQVFDFEGYKIIYSGDTVIDEDSRGDIELMRAWWRFSYTIQTANLDKKVLWLLISKGWRTYKFFPAFLKDFYPNKRVDTPLDVQRFIDRLSKFKFGEYYQNGLVIPKHADMLKSGKNDVPDKRLEDEDVAFFLKKNPEFYKGNELVCLAELSVDNLTKAGLRLLHGVRNAN